MRTEAKGSAETKQWDEKPYQELADGMKLSKATVRQGYTGDIEGEGLCEYLMTYSSDQRASYVGMQLISGTLGGKQGSFVLQLNGEYDGNEARGTWFVVPGSATGALKKLRGQGSFHAPQGSKMHYTLEYDFE
jgi:hypothetical protein